MKSHVLPAPAKPTLLSEEARWLAGEGAGSWFVVLIKDGHQIEASRYSPEGKLECHGVFNSESKINIKEGWELTYPSHCQIITLVQEGQTVRFTRLSDNG